MINTQLVLALVPLAIGAYADQAPKINKNPKNILAHADFPGGGDLGVRGNIIFSAQEGGLVDVNVDMTGLPREGGPFQYHIHDNAVLEDGNCDVVGLHFNPYHAPPDCDAQRADAFCQVGDLSGKHGFINTTCFQAQYTDPYLSLNKKSQSHIVGRSVTFHFANLTKFACANILLPTRERLETLQNEVDNFTINEVVKSLALQTRDEPYVFDEDEALGHEVLEPQDSFTELVPVTNGSNKTHPANYSNGTFGKYQHPDCENGSGARAVGYAAVLGAVIGALI